MNASMPQEGSEILSKYRVVRELGRGGMGAVFEVEHTVTGKRFAAKWMNPELLENAQARQRFVQEAQTACALDHPNVVEVFDVEVRPDGAFLLMELLKGESLADRLERGPMGLESLVPLLLPVLHALDEAHAAGIVHRDIKPDNVFLCATRTGGEYAKLLDFGISKSTAESQAKSGMRLTAAGVMMGTALYMAPEQTQDAGSADAQSDVYSFGAMLFEALTGAPPFESESFGKLVFRIMTEAPPDICNLRPDLPPGVGDVIMQCLAKEPQDRPAGAKGVALALTAALGQGEELFGPSKGAPSFSLAPAAPSVAERTPRAGWRWVAGLCVLAAMGVGVWFAMQARSSASSASAEPAALATPQAPTPEPPPRETQDLPSGLELPEPARNPPREEEPVQAAPPVEAMPEATPVEPVLGSPASARPRMRRSRRRRSTPVAPPSMPQQAEMNGPPRMQATVMTRLNQGSSTVDEFK